MAVSLQGARIRHRIRISVELTWMSECLNMLVLHISCRRGHTCVSMCSYKSAIFLIHTHPHAPPPPQPHTNIHAESYLLTWGNRRSVPTGNCRARGAEAGTRHIARVVRRLVLRDFGLVHGQAHGRGRVELGQLPRVDIALGIA